ncbi:hypothetical protein BaRGS_00022731 [Batillaria attramentaria]|uniref:Beta-1,4-galactosyltransferase n=1 Tax=Batillaria attramentaria TaxID=370345 RepID=A0ABD0KFX2_9CAEN
MRIVSDLKHKVLACASSRKFLILVLLGVLKVIVFLVCSRYLQQWPLWSNTKSRGTPLVLGPPGQPMVARGGVVVYPRAHVTPPWARDDTENLCPVMPPRLVGPLFVNTSALAPDPNTTVALNPGLEPGGHYHPPDCRARHRVAIIVPYRNRLQHLHALLHHLHPILRRQLLDYFILVVEMAMPTMFNRGMLLNIGAVEAVGLWDVRCFILHDVDMLPEDDRNLYTCTDQPRHMPSAIKKGMRPLYWLPRQPTTEAVVSLKKEHFSMVNGYSNLYFGWGAEDDDFANRLTADGLLKVTSPSPHIGRYRMFAHGADPGNDRNPLGMRLFAKWKARQNTDGLNSLQYEVKKVEFRPGYTWMLVSVSRNDSTHHTQ